MPLERQEEGQNRRRGSNQGRVERNTARFSTVNAPELGLLDGLCFSDCGGKVEYPAQTESGAKMQTSLKKPRCACHGRDENQKSPARGNPEYHTRRP